MFPSAPSVIVIVPEFVPEFVLKIKFSVPPVVTVSVPAPFEVNVAAAPESPTLTVSAARTTSPVPFGTISISAFEVDTISFPLTSKLPPNCGEVSSTTSDIPRGISRISGFVPSFAVAKTTFVAPLPTATLDPDPETYLKVTVCDPLVEFFKT